MNTIQEWSDAFTMQHFVLGLPLKTHAIPPPQRNFLRHQILRKPQNVRSHLLFCLSFSDLSFLIRLFLIFPFLFYFHFLLSFSFLSFSSLRLCKSELPLNSGELQNISRLCNCSSHMPLPKACTSHHGKFSENPLSLWVQKWTKSNTACTEKGKQAKHAKTNCPFASLKVAFERTEAWRIEYNFFLNSLCFTLAFFVVKQHGEKTSSSLHLNCSPCRSPNCPWSEA